MNPIRIVVMPGDGIGPEVIKPAVSVLRQALANVGVDLETAESAIGGAAIDQDGTPLPDATLAACLDADAALLGAVGGPAWDHLAGASRPEAGLLRIRSELGLWANLRPVRVRHALRDLSPVRPERLVGVDILFVRELTGGLYFGTKIEEDEVAVDTCRYTATEIERIVRRACQLATARRGRVTQVDKANVLATSRLWRRTADRVASEVDDIELEHVLVDAMAMYCISDPARFDVVVTENLFGDVLTDAASVLVGSLGLLPSASLGDGPFGLYEPVHGSAPELAGKDCANPVGAIESAAMLARHSLRMPEVASAIEDAVDAALAQGLRTADLTTTKTPSLSTRQFGEAVCRMLKLRSATAQ